MKKTLSTLVALVLALLMVIPACSAFAEEERITLTVGVPVSSMVLDYKDNYMTKLMEDELNLNLEFVTYASAEMVEKLNIEVNSGGEDLPDVIVTGLSDATVYSWALEGAIVPLTDYFHEDMHLYKSLEKTDLGKDAVLSLITSPDGEIYGFPAQQESIGVVYQRRLWINEVWLEKLELEIPTTPDELYNVLKAFKTQDPNGNGLADELPFLSYAGGLKAAKSWLISMFGNAGFTYNGLAPDAEGTIYATYATDYYRDALRYIRKLVEEELMAPMSFTYDVNQYTAAVQSDPHIVGSAVVAAMSYQLPAGDPRRLEWTTVPPIADKDGVYHNPVQPTIPKISFVVTKNCKNVEAAFRLGDLMTSERVTVINRWGEQGVDWITPPEGSTALYASMGYEPYLLETGAIQWSGTPHSKHWHNLGPVVRGFHVAGGMVWNGDPMDPEYQIAQEVPKMIGKEEQYNIGKLIFTDEENEIVSETLSTLNSFVDESFANFTTGVWDIEKDWDNYLNELQVIGLDEMLETMQVVYDRMYK